MRLAFLHPIEYNDLIDKVNIDPIKIKELFTKFGLEFSSESFEITQNEWPNLNDFDVLVISGSPNSAYEDLAWIKPLELTIQGAYKAGKKLLGICFGHQVIAKALGGAVQNADKGWLLGLHDLTVSKPQEWMQPFKESPSLYFINHDQVTSLPAGAEVLASNASCPKGMFVIANQVLCLQAHPEQDKGFLETIIKELDGQLDDEILAQARASLAEKPDQELLFKWMIQFLKAA